MMKHSPLAVLLTACILCCGCTASKPAQSLPDDGSEPEPLLTDLTDKPVLTESAVLTKQVPDETTEPKQSEPDVLIPAPEISQPDYQGGDGGEEHAETPLPEYFTYRFYENGLSARLAGGMYQALEADLSAVSPLDAETGYYLYDSDFDGDLDLSVPVLYTESQKRFAVFLWDAETAHFAETPVILTDPQYFPEEQHLTAMEQDAAEATVTDYIWKNGTLTEMLTAKANAEDLNLLVHAKDENGNAVDLTLAAADQDKLTEMLLQYYRRETALQTDAA